MRRILLEKKLTMDRFARINGYGIPQEVPHKEYNPKLSHDTVRVTSSVAYIELVDK